MVLRWTYQILAFAYFAVIIQCGILESFKEITKTTTEENGTVGEEEADICPPENSVFPVHLAHPRDCRKFYVCDGGTPHMKSCQPVLHFNPRVNACDYPKNAGCDKKQEMKEKDRIAERGLESCPLENSGHPVYLKHESDCGKFYMCDSGEAHLKSCQPGLHFNPKVNACDYPKNAGCNKSTGINEKSKITEYEIQSCPEENSDVPVYLSHPSDCGKFYICDNGRPLLKSCQPGLHFNTKVNACDYPKNAGCDRSTGIKEKGKITEYELQSCPEEDSDVPVYLSHPSNCGKFYICDNGRPLLKSCQPGLHFNTKVNACDYPKNVGCDKKLEVKGKKGTSEEERDACPPENSIDPVYLTHPKECGKFYVCDNGTPQLQSCPTGLHFNPKVNACDYPKNAECDKNSPNVRTVGDTSHVCPDSSTDIPTYYRHPTYCNSFYVCDSGNLHEGKCPSGLHFNSDINVCDYPKNVKCDTVLQTVSVSQIEIAETGDPLDSCPFQNGGRPSFLPHPTECDKFFVCSGGKKFPFTCPSGLYFNSKQEACDFPENTDCERRKLMRAGASSPFCPPMDGNSPVFFRHSDNCNVYYMCGNGLAYEFSCPARLHFNLRKKVCDYENNANCKKSAS